MLVYYINSCYIRKLMVFQDYLLDKIRLIFMQILNESRRDDMLLPYVNLLRGKGVNTNVSQLKQFLLAKFVNEGLIRNLSLSSNFYLAGVARYYFNGDLTTNKVLNVYDESQKDVFNEEICERLNACILVLRNAYIDTVGTQFEQPEDFGELKLNALLRKYKKKIDEILNINANRNANDDAAQGAGEIDNTFGNGYTFDILYSYQDARKYKRYTEPGAWCITYGEQHYNGYINRLKIHYVILRQNGFENVPRRKGENWTKKKPHDEYGNSLIALLQSNSSGEPVFITSRWNHGSYEDGTYGCEADHAYTKEELFRATGMNDDDLQRIFKIWNQELENRGEDKKTLNAVKKKKNTDLLRYIKYGQMRMNGGEKIEDVFPGVSGTLLYGNKDNFKKALIGLRIPMNVNGEKIHGLILCDKYKMVWETFKMDTSAYGRYASDAFVSSETEKNVYDSKLHHNHLVRIRYDKTYTMFYDIKRSSLIQIDGITKFKYTSFYGVSSYNAEHCVFYEVAMTNEQRAFIDYKTNKPLRLPNGSYWFESCRSAKRYRNGGGGRDVRVDEVMDNDLCLMFTYDSSADITFYYDIATKRFFKPETEGEKAVNLTNSSCPEGYYSIGFNTNNHAYLQEYSSFFKEGRRIDINGNTKWDNYNVLSYGIGQLTDINKKNYIFDFNTNEFITLTDNQNNPIEYKYISSIFGYGGNGLEIYRDIIWISIPDLYYQDKLLYNCKERKLYINPLTKGYIFYQYNDNFGTSGKNPCELYTHPKHFILTKYGVKHENGMDILKPGTVNPTEKITLDEIIEHNSQITDYPEFITNELDDLKRWVKEFPDRASDTIKNYVENLESQNEYRMAESKTSMEYIINEILKRIN